jgi:hypothetical protein
VDDWSDDGHIERLGGNLGSWNDVVVELLAAASRTAGRIPGLSACA